MPLSCHLLGAANCFRLNSEKFCHTAETFKNSFRLESRKEFNQIMVVALRKRVCYKLLCLREAPVEMMNSCPVTVRIQRLIKLVDT